MTESQVPAALFSFGWMGFGLSAVVAMFSSFGYVLMGLFSVVWIVGLYLNIKQESKRVVECSDG